MSEHIKVACVQLTSTTDIGRNIDISSELIREAHGAGAQLISLPEVVNLVQRSRRKSAEVINTEDEETSLKAYRELAAELGVWLHTGSLVIKLLDDERNVNRSFLIDDKGAIAATYDKIHMFDADVGDGKMYRESASFSAGQSPVIAHIDNVPCGLTICYDVRFAHLYRRLALDGAQLFLVPAAFTALSGKAHWHVLLRARAIETGCYIVAPAQSGTHADGRKTYGHSLIINPWGEIMAEAQDGDSIIYAALDLSATARARNAIPSLKTNPVIGPTRMIGP